MNGLVLKFILVLSIILILSGCAGLSTYTNTTDYDDGFYQGGKGKKDWAHRY